MKNEKKHVIASFNMIINYLSYSTGSDGREYENFSVFSTFSFFSRVCVCSTLWLPDFG